MVTLSTLLVGATFLVLGIGTWLGKGADITNWITAVYVVLVYFQVRQTQRQHDETRIREERLAPKLDLPEIRIRQTTESDPTGRVTLGPALYINCTVKNTGGGMANHTQPVLTNAAERLPDGRWLMIPDWLQLGLRWSLDEIGANQGQPTQERNLSPQRPYLFDVGKVSAYGPRRQLDLLTLVRPNGQRTSFGAGRYCFEVTVYSENAAPVRMWCDVTIDGDLNSSTPLQLERLRAAPWSA